MVKKANIYQHSVPPFSVTYPSDWSPINSPPDQNVVFVAGAPGFNLTLTIGVTDIPQGMALCHATKTIVGSMEMVMREIRIISDSKMELNECIPANVGVIEFSANGFTKLKGVLVNVFKRNKWVYVAVTTLQGSYSDDLHGIAGSLKFH